ncbi:OprO/OprP family phosphate-selective porin [Candidatus Aminicenantes bacterium AH-873-B07]|nr:OprO/OprP family phosphate-selective porin [Candidatus Aminicenantes bacterium AH-873-B07]
MNNLKIFLCILLVVLLISFYIYPNEIKSGYQKGFYIKTKDGKFVLKLKNRVQFLTFYNNYNGIRPAQRSFQIKRARLYLSGNAFYSWLNYKIQLQMEKSQIAIRDLFINLTFFKEISPNIGQFKVPFDREYLTSSAYLQLIDRSLTNEEFRVGRDIGFSLNGNISDRIEYSIGIFNGSGKNSRNLDNNFLYAGRLMFTPNGEFPYSQSSLEFPEKRKFAFGIGILYFPNFDPSRENLDDRKHLAFIAKEVDTGKSDIFQLTTDIGVKYKGFSFEGDFHFRNINPKNKNIESVRALGFRIQGGYLIFKKFELAFRYSLLNPSTKKLKDLKYEFTTGINYFIYEHFLKFQINYSYLIFENPIETEKQTKFEAQIQLYF